MKETRNNGTREMNNGYFTFNNLTITIKINGSYSETSTKEKSAEWSPSKKTTEKSVVKFDNTTAEIELNGSIEGSVSTITTTVVDALKEQLADRYVKTYTKKEDAKNIKEEFDPYEDDLY